ncbi:hypothetical protein PGB90_006161 [Kerria lacca]
MKKNLVECEDGLDIPEEDDYDDEIVNNHRKDKRLMSYRNAHIPSKTFAFFFVKIHCKGGIGFGIKREIFFLNLEDGYFGCQVNQSTDVLQLYELSKLCDGYQDCFQGSDELARELKCTSKCPIYLKSKHSQ